MSIKNILLAIAAIGLIWYFFLRKKSVVTSASPVAASGEADKQAQINAMVTADSSL